MKRQEKRRPDHDGQWVYTMCELLKGGVAAGVITILALLLCAVLMSVGLLREEWIEGTVLACCVIGSFVGGELCIKRVRSKTILIGLAVGGILFLLLLTAGLLAFESSGMKQGGIGILCASLCGGGISGLLGGREKKKRRR